MEYWLRQRKWEVVAPQHISINNFAIPSFANTGERKSELDSGFRSVPPIDTNVPFVLCRFFQDTVSMRVLQTQTKKQFFLFVRDNISAAFAKKQLVGVLCTIFLPIAPCVIVTGRISVASLQDIRMLSVRTGHNVEIVNIADISFDKMDNFGFPTYRVLQQDEIRAIESAKKIKSIDFPRILVCDPAAIYCGFHIGQVLEKLDKRTGTISYRIVASASGLVSQPKDSSQSKESSQP